MKKMLLSNENTFEDTECDSIMSAAKFPVSPQWAIFNNDRNYAEMFEPESFHVRSQDLKECFYDASQFILANQVQSETEHY